MTKHTYTQILKSLFSNYFDFSFLASWKFSQMFFDVLEAFCKLLDVIWAFSIIIFILFLKLIAPVSYPIIALITLAWHNKEYQKYLDSQEHNVLLKDKT